MDKTELLNALSEQELTVTFTKKDGSERVMKCTRNLSVIPTDMQPKGTMQSVEESDNIKVFDTEQQGWRSFNFASVVNVL